MSLDALRGFDMFWIIGGETLVASVARATDWPVLHWLEEQTTHVEWDGFRLWDLVFPLFLFIAGVAMPFSLTARRDAGASRAGLARKVVRRGLVLVFLGVLYNGLLGFDFDELRYASVLGRIGLAYAFAALLVIYLGVRWQITAAIALLLGYWAALSWIPVPHFGAGDLSPGANLTDYIDQLLLPGRLHRGDRDPEGLLSTLPAVATALSGALTGHYLRREPPQLKQVLVMLGIGALLCALGRLWHPLFPINKNLWSSSFVLWTSGLSLTALALFYAIIDVWGIKRWAFFFIVIGSNAIAIYLLNGFIDFDGLAAFLLGGGGRRFHPALLPLAAILLRWHLLWWMYRRRIFLRV